MRFKSLSKATQRSILHPHSKSQVLPQSPGPTSQNNTTSNIKLYESLFSVGESKHRVDVVQPLNILVQLTGVLLEETPERESFHVRQKTG